MGTRTDNTDKGGSSAAPAPPDFEQFVANRIAPPGRCQALILIQGLVTKKPDKKTIEVAGVEFTVPAERVAQLLETAKDGEKAIASYWPLENGQPESLMSLKEGLIYKELVAPVMILRGFVKGREGDQNIRVRVEYRREGMRGEKFFDVMLARPLAQTPRFREMSEFRAVYMKGRWIATQVAMRKPPPGFDRPPGPRGPRPTGGPPRGRPPFNRGPGGPPRPFQGPPRPRFGGPPRPAR